MDHEEKKQPAGSLNRRDLLKAMTMAPAAALVPLAPGLAAAAAASPAQAEHTPPGAYQPKTFNAHQWKTLRVVSDLIVPADDHSGSATQSGAPEYIDEILHLRGGLRKTEILGWLTWADMESNRLYHHDFVDCPVAQQKQLLDRVAYPGKAEPADANAVSSFNHVRDAVLGGYYSSKMGIKDLQYLGNQMVEDWTGCPSDVTSRLNVNYSNWEYWNKGAGEES
ncbi:MAG TPA: gluconate 2-dehydrogenase subunit 3 family protein [Terriglobia bacterium]|nr:gluconate 2-dehydrogenase subunit 3 family protein [Terriglobia bacterium]